MNSSEPNEKQTEASADLCSIPEVQAAIKETLPKSKGQRNKMVFKLCRYLKAIPDTKDLSASALKPIIKAWHEKALSTIGTKPFTETYSDFMYGWARVKHPKDEDCLALATQIAIGAADSLPDEDRYADAPEVQLLIRVCFELQQIQGEKPFWLAARDAGGIIGESTTKANKYLQMLVHDDPPVLEIAKKHTTNRATRYRFVGKGPTQQQAEGDTRPKQGLEPKHGAPSSGEQGEAA